MAVLPLGVSMYMYLYIAYVMYLSEVIIAYVMILQRGTPVSVNQICLWYVVVRIGAVLYTYIGEFDTAGTWYV